MALIAAATAQAGPADEAGHGESGLGTRPSPSALARPCLACHSGGESSVIPDIRGKSEGEFESRLREFRDRRPDSVMHRIARGYRDDDYRALARYFRALDRERH